MCHVKPPRFDFVVADSATEAGAAFERCGGEARLPSGGQRLVTLLNMRLVRPTAVVDMNGISEFDGVVEYNRQVRIGALRRYSTLERSWTVRSRLGLLGEAVTYVGDRQVRNRGDARGHSSSSRSPLPRCFVALALAARIVAGGPSGRRDIATGDFFPLPGLRRHS